MKALSFLETEKLLGRYNIPLVKTKICKSQKRAIAFSKKIGYPLVLKISSPDILHKTDIGGVAVGIKAETELKKSFAEILKNVKTKKPKATIEGVLVQEQIPGIEIVIGAKRDPVFGPVLMFGLGGIFVELLKDISLRVAPVGKKEAEKMISEIKGYKALKSYRGRAPVKVDEVSEIIRNLSTLCLNHPEIKEIDLNPIIVNEKGAKVVDARFIL